MGLSRIFIWLWPINGRKQEYLSPIQLDYYSRYSYKIQVFDSTRVEYRPSIWPTIRPQILAEYQFFIKKRSGVELFAEVWLLPVLFLSSFFLCPLSNIFFENLLPLLGRQQQISWIKHDLVKLFLPRWKRRNLFFGQQITELGHASFEGNELSFFGRSDLGLHGGLLPEVDGTLFEDFFSAAIGCSLLFVQLVLENKLGLWNQNIKLRVKLYKIAQPL